jgi:hypothetical protein
MADFVRRYEVGSNQKQISIPVRKEHVADILASLNLFGDVKLESPPSFRPANNNDGNLSIDTANVLESLANSLSGAQVVAESVGEKITGTLLGVHSEYLGKDPGGSTLEQKQLSVLTAAGIKSIPIAFLTNLQFTEETVQSEITKALQRNFQQIKPNSTFVELAVKGTSEKSEATVQYTVPSAAWKISYRMAQRGDATNFKGLAIVDNNTEEDWKEVDIAVVTGEPITFSTDLADSKTPARRHVNVVNEQAHGAVEVERGFTRSSKRALRASPTDSVSLCSMAAGDANLDMYYSAECAPEGMSNAMRADTEIKEVGDFSIFKSANPVTIPALQSALIPVFDAVLKNAKTVLHFNQKNNQTRSYRSIQFKNETAHSLGRGVCTFYQDGVYSGSGIIPATKQNEEQLLPYALETGVRFESKQGQIKQQLIGLNISGGLAITKQGSQVSTTYTIENSKNEEFEVYVDHASMWNGTLTATIDRKKIEAGRTLLNGVRYSFKVAANETATLKVNEQNVNSSQVNLGSNHLSWLASNFAINDGPLVGNKNLQEIINQSEKVAGLRQEVAQLNAKSQKLVAKQARIRENLKASGNAPESGEWRQELMTIDANIDNLDEKELPKLEKSITAEEKKLTELLKKLVFDFAAEIE